MLSDYLEGDVKWQAVLAGKLCVALNDGRRLPDVMTLEGVDEAEEEQDLHRRFSAGEPLDPIIAEPAEIQGRREHWIRYLKAHSAYDA